jgi:2-iminobutanoate/2-iminopropanoate deaminase
VVVNFTFLIEGGESMKLRKSVVGTLFLVLCVAAGAADRKFIVKQRPADTKALPFSDAVLVGNTLYIAGHIGLDAKTGQAPADAEEEAKLVMDGIKQTVESAGMSMDDVVSVQVFCTDLKLYDTFNAVYRPIFTATIPPGHLSESTSCCAAEDTKSWESRSKSRSRQPVNSRFVRPCSPDL